MDRYTFYSIFFDNIYLFLTSIIFVTFFAYYSIKKLSITGILDPVHFYWTFTFGTAYGVVVGLYLNGYISTHTFLIIAIYCLTLVFFINLFLKIKIKPFNKLFKKIFLHKYEPKILFYFILFLFIINTIIILYFIGFGFLAEENRFEQNKGMGIFVRIFAVFRLFLVAYFTLLLNSIFKKYGFFNINFLFKVLLFVLFIFITILIDGAKFGLLESILVIILSLYLINKNVKISFIKVIYITIISFVFATAIYSVNIDKHGLSEKKSIYITDVPFVIEAITLRILANADKYFLSLPNDIIETVETKNIFVRLLAPMIGSSRMSKIVGYDVNSYSIGKQILLYWNPKFDTAGGPTSHYDLFAYKQFGFLDGLIWVILTAFIFVGIKNITLLSLNTKFSISVFSVLWFRSFAFILEPPLGLAYIIDVLLIFGLLVICYLIVKGASGASIKYKKI